MVSSVKVDFIFQLLKFDINVLMVVVSFSDGVKVIWNSLLGMVLV